MRTKLFSTVSYIGIIIKNESNFNLKVVTHRKHDEKMQKKRQGGERHKQPHDPPLLCCAVTSILDWLLCCTETRFS